MSNMTKLQQAHSEDNFQSQKEIAKKDEIIAQLKK